MSQCSKEMGSIFATLIEDHRVTALATLIEDHRVTALLFLAVLESGAPLSSSLEEALYKCSV